MIFGNALRNKQKTHCKHGHEFTPENTKWSKKHPNQRACRACGNAHTKRAFRAGKMSKNTVSRVLTALNEGATVMKLLGKGGHNNAYVRGTKICDHTALKNFMANNPKLGARMKKMLVANAKAAILRANQSRRIMAAPALIRNDGRDAYAAIIAATRDIPATIAGDVQSEMFLAVAEGRLKIGEIQYRVRDFISMQNRADRNSVFNPWGHLSLDKPLNDGDATFMSVIREDQRLWA